MEIKVISADDLPGPYVDIAGIQWASCNLGAKKPCDYGDYYMWGSTTPNTKDDCFWVNYPLCKGSDTALTKYNSDSTYGTVDNKTVLEAEDDAIYQATNGIARMPTQAEFQSLYNNTKQELCYCDTAFGHEGHTKVYGMLFTSKANSDNKIFIPFSGGRNGTSVFYTGGGTSLWSSSLYSGDSHLAYYLYCDYYGNVNPLYYDDRYYGFALRGVKI